MQETEIMLLLNQNDKLRQQNAEFIQGEFEQFKVIREVIQRNGKEKQVYIAIEEMAELTKELIKDKRGFDNHEQIVEEIADVEIMMQQLCLIFKCSNDVVSMRRKKIERLKTRLENAEKSE